MKTTFGAAAVAIAMIAGWTSLDSIAKVSPGQAAQLDGPKYTCDGAERAGSAGGVAAYTGKYDGTWPGVSKPYGYEPGPYADEKPMFTITAQNMSKYADNLTPGEKALLTKYPQAYRMNVYPSHRDFKVPDWICERVKKNAVTSELVHDGLGVTGIAGVIPFPFPQSGLEAVWNASIGQDTPWSEKVVYDFAAVYRNSNTGWGRSQYMSLAPVHNQKELHSYLEPVQAHFYIQLLMPERERGFVTVGYLPNDYSGGTTRAWQYLPGTRRVREAPEVAFDYPQPPYGLSTTDDDSGFNGSPERYNWKLVGKKEVYLPYDNFKINDPSIKYQDLVKPGALNPEYVRYELHRVWIIEGALKPGVRHIYSKRVLYADEDTWLTMMADNYDARGQLWRAAMIAFNYSQESKGWHRGVETFYDLSEDAYEALYLVNERGNDWWRLNTPLSESQFTPAAAAQGGH